MHDLVEMTRRFSVLIENERDVRSILKHLKSEVAELAIEVENGSKGPDGIVGEAIDIILCALDMIFVHDPSVSNAEILRIAEAKNLKWAVKYGKLDREPPEGPTHLPQGHNLDELDYAGWSMTWKAGCLQAALTDQSDRILASGRGVDATYVRWSNGHLTALHGLYTAFYPNIGREPGRPATLTVYDTLFVYGRGAVARARAADGLRAAREY